MSTGFVNKKGPKVWGLLTGIWEAYSGNLIGINK